MRSLFIGALVLGLLGFAPSAHAAFDLQSFLGAAARFVQNAFSPEEENGAPEEEQNPEDFVDPAEIRRVTQDIKNMRRELTRFAKQIQKLPNSSDDATQIQNLLGELSSAEQKLQSGTDVRETLQDFYDARIWEDINKIRAKIEVPKEITQWTKEIKRAEKSLALKKYQTLGLDTAQAKQKLQEVKNMLVQVESFYGAGDLESAIETLDEVRQDFHPGEVMGVADRMYQIATALKRVKDATVKTQIQNVLQDAVSEFNSGEYRAARELMDEAAPEIMKIITTVTSAGKKKVNVQQNMNQLGEKIKEKMETIRQKGEETERRKEEMQKPPMPQQTPPPADGSSQKPKIESSEPQSRQIPVPPTTSVEGGQQVPVTP